MTSGILFDFNGVLVNDEPLHCQALTHTLAEYGIEIDEETYYREYLGFDDRECFRFTFVRFNRPADGASIAEATDRKNARYQRLLRDGIPMVPGAAAFVHAAAAAGHRMAIVSGALRREIEFVLAQENLSRYFELIVAAEDVPACKPDPAGYLRARQALALTNGHAVAIEDSLPGLAAARAAGLRCAMLTTSHSADALRSADAVWPDFTGRGPSGPAMERSWLTSRSRPMNSRVSGTVRCSFPSRRRFSGSKAPGPCNACRASSPTTWRSHRLVRSPTARS